MERLLEWSDTFNTEIELVDQQHRPQQRMEHSSFIFDVKRMYAEISIDDNIDDRFEKLIQFVASWLVYHTLRTDQHMAFQIKAIKEGKSPRDAYDDTKEKATNPAISKKVIDAVLHLWAESAERVNFLEEKLKMDRASRERVVPD